MHVESLLNSTDTELFTNFPCAPGAAIIVAEIVGNLVEQDRPARQVRAGIEELIAQGQRKDEFLALLGHELRTPLAAMHNGLRLLSDGHATLAARARVHVLLARQLRHMTQLVDDLLDVSRISSSCLRLQRERIDLRAALQNSIETLASQFSERAQCVTVELPDAPVWLHADPGRLEQVFVNLLANAGKYTNDGGRVTVSLQLVDGHAVVRIRDSGIGIAPDALLHIFDLFQHVESVPARCQSGLGIGLALAKNLIELHGGSVTASSAGPDQGCEFSVRLAREH